MRYKIYDIISRIGIYIGYGLNLTIGYKIEDWAFMKKWELNGFQNSWGWEGSALEGLSYEDITRKQQ